MEKTTLTDFIKRTILKNKFILIFLIVLTLMVVRSNTQTFMTKKVCFSRTKTIRARRKTCFLRPDSGPCRADIVQWYFDAKEGKCFRFYWGGCQGNGNKFTDKKACTEYCYLNSSVQAHIPYYCSLTYDYGSCFGHYNRWYYDKDYKVCKRRIYSGCGGNQNNFETMEECQKNCITPPGNTMQGGAGRVTGYTCFTFDIGEMVEADR